MPADLFIPVNFSTRAFYFQHLAAYAYVKRFAQGKIVLDAGTSIGYGASYLSDAAKEVVGIDIDAAGLESARKRYPGNNLKYVVSNILNIQFPDGYFDIVVSSQVIEHIELEQLDRYLSEIYRVLKKEGVFFVSTLNLLANLKGRPVEEYDKCKQHVKEFTAGELKNFLRTRFSSVEVLGLRRGRRHGFYNLLKKSGVFKKIPAIINPVKRFFDGMIDVDDFVYAPSNINKSINLMGVCRK